MNPNVLKGAAGSLAKRPILRLPEANRLMQNALRYQQKGVIKMNEQQIIDLASSVERPDGAINEDKLEELRKIVLKAAQTDTSSHSGSPAATRSSDFTSGNANQRPGPASWSTYQSESSTPSESGSPGSKRGGSGCIVS